MAKTGFFRATAEATDRLAMFYDWFSPALIGLYRLKSEVAHEISNGNNAEKALEAQFARGSGIRWSAFRGLNRRSWSGILADASVSLITEGCSIFEGWLESVFTKENAEDVFMAFNAGGSYSFRDAAIKGLQRPDGSPNYDLVLKYLRKNAPTSASFLNQAISSELKKSVDNYDAAMLVNLLKYYRFIKECRNSYVHCGVVVSKRCEEAYNACRLLTSGDLGVTSLPKLPKIKIGDKIRLDLYTANAFIYIISRLIRIYDIELIESRVGVETFKSQWRESQRNCLKTFSADPNKARRQLFSWLNRFYNFKITDEDAMRRFLSEERLCNFC